MKAVVCQKWCQPSDLVLADIPRPTPAPSDVLVRVHTAALNFPDVLIIGGQYQFKPPLPFTPGFELVGTVEEVGSAVKHIEKGARVVAQCDLGGFAEYAVAPLHSVRPVPPGLDDEQAAAFPLVYQTSYFGLVYRGQLAKGETVLVHSAAGGVGLAAVQIAKALGAGKIIGTVGSDDKRAAVLASGADLVLNYQTEDFVEGVKQATGGRGADVIYDPVGGDLAEQSTKCIAFEGRLVIIGFTSGQFPTFRGNHILVKNYSVVGLHWGFYRQMNPAKIEQGWRELMELFKTGVLRPVIAARYPFDRVADAMNLLTSRRAIGKIVLHW
ncbi:MAG: NADPH:quinone oxidoreductase family protein [Planctomycetia bacterium]|nr:NADPH:quinone oxidoreductase family protein [Planctomycetia bacterium]